MVVEMARSSVPMVTVSYLATSVTMLRIARMDPMKWDANMVGTSHCTIILIILKAVDTVGNYSK